MVIHATELDQQDPNKKRYTVTRLNWAGLGVVEVGDRSRCVPFTQRGERVKVRWHDAGWGRMVGERIDQEADRARLDEQAGCAQARRCTGCSLRQLSLSQQRIAQEESHLGALRRLSGRPLQELEVDWLASPAQDGYRTRVTARVLWHDTTKDWRLSLRPHWGEPIDLSRCPNHPPELRQVVSRVNEWVSENAERLGLIDKDEEAHDFTLTRISVQSGEGLPSWIVLHAEDHSFRGSVKKERRVRRLEAGRTWVSMLPVNALSSVDTNIYAELTLRDQSRTGTGVLKLKGDSELLWICPRGHRFAARPPAWLPQTPSTVESLRATIERCLWGDSYQTSQERDGELTTVFELGCGIGVMGIALAQTRPKLRWYGVDIEPSAIECAAKSAALNGMDDRVSFAALDGRRGLAESPLKITHLVIHAMRRPLSGLLTLASRQEIERLCYLAPSAPALARDLAEAPEYRIDRLFMIDQMPGTAQVMTIAQLTLHRQGET